jgi:hypothetical protein
MHKNKLYNPQELILHHSKYISRGSRRVVKKILLTNINKKRRIIKAYIISIELVIVYRIHNLLLC